MSRRRDPHDIFTPRGITPPSKPGGRAAREQGFARYEGADWHARRAIIAEHEPLYAEELSPDRGKLLRRVRPDRIGREGEGLVYSERRSRQSWETWLRGALSVDGWLMPRHAVMPDHEDSDFRYRPVAQLRPDVPVQGRLLPAHTHRRLRAERRGREQASPRTQHAASVCDLDADGNVLPTGHLHPHTGEVVVPLEGRHAHWDQAKYLYTPGNSARRLGTSPLSLESGYEADELFVVVLEGTLKMVAVTEAGYPAIDAGSVTLWKSETAGPEGMISELAEFADRHLQGRNVAVVCDSDWHANRLVLSQTQTVTDILTARGARAVACAPPEGRSLGWRHPYTGAKMRAKRGVDDWLGEHAPGDRHEAMLELVFHERVADSELTADHPALAGVRSDGRETTVALVRALGELARPDDRVAPYAEERLMASLGRAKLTVQQARRRAMERRLIEELTEAERRYDADGGFYMVAPLVRVAPEGMPTYRVGTLRDWL
jgi:hypothetical protein